MSVLTQFQPNRPQCDAVMDGRRGKLANVVSEVPQGYVLWPLLLTSLWLQLSSRSERVAPAESPIRDLNRVSEWCDLWGMKLNESKTKTKIISRSRTMHPQSPP